MKTEPGELHPGGDHVLDEQLRIGGVGAKLRRQVRLGRRIAERRLDEHFDVRGPRPLNLGLNGVVDDELRMPAR